MENVIFNDELQGEKPKTSFLPTMGIKIIIKYVIKIDEWLH